MKMSLALLFLRADRISPVHYCAAALGWPPTSGSGPQMPPPVLLVLSRASRATLPVHTYIRMHARTCMLHAHARLHACTHVSVHDVVYTHTLHVFMHARMYDVDAHRPCPRRPRLSLIRSQAVMYPPDAMPPIHYMCLRACVHIYTCTLRARIHINIHTYVHTHTHTRAHTRTHPEVHLLHMHCHLLPRLRRRH